MKLLKWRKTSRLLFTIKLFMMNNKFTIAHPAPFSTGGFFWFNVDFLLYTSILSSPRCAASRNCNRDQQRHFGSKSPKPTTLLFTCQKYVGFFLDLKTTVFLCVCCPRYAQVYDKSCGLRSQPRKVRHTS